jgi:outer membrane protein OmpA-like peptidoglycan-associated protein
VKEGKRGDKMKNISAFLTVSGILLAQASQAPNPTQQAIPTGNAAGPMPVYRITVVSRTTKAINYNHRSGSTNIDFRGTSLLPEARGEARVESKQGVIKIDAHMQKLQPATKYGPEYLTYVMWAITPEGRATNVGEVLLNGENSKLNATTELQSFGLIVTAEPYFAVTQPSDVVVMENIVRHDTTGTIEEVDAKYELLQRGQYVLNVNPAEIKTIGLDPKVPLELYEARNAVQIARWTGAQHYAPETFLKAVQGLENGEGYLKGKSGKKPIGTVAREAVQMAEDARIITVKKIAEEQLANERQAGADRESRAESSRAAAQSERAIAQSETDRVTREAAAAQVAANADTERLKLEHAAQTAAAQAEADRVRRESDAQLAGARAEALRVKGDNDAQAAAARAEADRLRLESEAARTTAQLDIALAGRQKAEAEAGRAAAEAAQQAAQAEIEKGRLAVQEADRLRLKSEAEKTELRAQLLSQFNAILQTRDTARGLIVNMSDVLFDTARHSLRPVAREKLAKVAGIISGHPGLKLQVEGHTDSVGGEDYNQKLSEERGMAVRDYLTQQGMAANSVTTRGFGKTQPVASNATAAGRQQNRRVELVISGEIIGVSIQAPVAAR